MFDRAHGTDQEGDIVTKVRPPSECRNIGKISRWYPFIVEYASVWYFKAIRMTKFQNCIKGCETLGQLTLLGLCQQSTRESSQLLHSIRLAICLKDTATDACKIRSAPLLRALCKWNRPSAHSVKLHIYENVTSTRWCLRFDTRGCSMCDPNN